MFVDLSKLPKYKQEQIANLVKIMESEPSISIQQCILEAIKFTSPTIYERELRGCEIRLRYTENIINCREYITFDISHSLKNYAEKRISK